jgi:hypothetical protein
MTRKRDTIKARTPEEFERWRRLAEEGRQKKSAKKEKRA